jgi:hypothetical protein
MMIQQFACALGAVFIDGAFGLGASVPRAIGLGLARRLLARVALLESFKVDHFSHNHPSCSGIGESGRFGKESVRRNAKTRTGRPGPHCQEFLSNWPQDSIKKYVSLCENEYLVLYHSGG